MSVLDSSKLASFSFILFEISAETLLAGWTKVSIFSSQASVVTESFLLVSIDGLDDEGAGLIELVEAECEREEEEGEDRSLDSLVMVTGFESEEEAPLLCRADLAKDLYPWMALS